MIEPVLKALVNFFILISDLRSIAEISGKVRDFVKLFLSHPLNSELVRRYIIIFDDYLIQYEPENTDRGRVKI